ncbi:amino acid adenylation domain-containing protein [Streptomyces sp. NPDC056465]|uniref:amino acid adenylation domain-containing protein n=1 Tax=unclassified Streptomyces TaxID=2593676 RepID=UPI0036D055A0
MAVADALPEEHDIPSRFSFGGSCSLVGQCSTARRTTYLPDGTAAHLLNHTPELLVTAVLLLARKYGNSREFRIGVRRASWSADQPTAHVVASMPSTMTVEQHRQAVTVSLDRIDATHPAGGGVQPELICVVDGPAEGRYGADLVISVEVTAHGTALHVDFHQHVHGAVLIDRMLGHVTNLLRQITGRPRGNIGELVLLTGPEQDRFRDLNDTVRSFPSDTSLYALFAEQVRSLPDRVAVSHEQDTLTYRELEEKALRLAERLHVHGVRRHDRIAFELEKTPHLMVAVLAVLRLGAAYVPISTGLPANRRAFLLADSGATLLLVDEQSVRGAGVPTLDMSEPDEGARACVLPDMEVSPQDAAYVMYTSGTTGRPKGVLVSHRAVVRLVRDTGYVSLSPRTRMLQTGAIAFDATTFEFWGALLNGGSIVLVPEPTVLNAVDLGAAISRYEVNTLFLTTALFHQIVEQDPSVLSACQVVIGGDALSARHAATAVEACPDSVFINAYGPTENTTFSTTHRVTGRYPGRVPIGRPISNSTAYVLDADGHEQPIGVPGELFVGGDGLSDGYLNRPGLNDSAFVLGKAGAPERLYRTGDIARWTEDGELDFIGRADQQVKIRGFRVEPAEVEAHLSRLPSVREAVVLLRRRTGDVSVLTACFTAEKALSGKDLRDALLEELPEYMVPSSFTQLDSLPLNRNQKIDRAALEALVLADDSTPAGSRLAPRTELEATVAEVFAEVLGLNSVSVDDDFFALGGHSLLATRLWSRLRSVLGTEFGLRQILDSPTAAGLAASLAHRTEARATRPRLVRRSS